MFGAGFPVTHAIASVRSGVPPPGWQQQNQIQQHDGQGMQQGGPPGNPGPMRVAPPHIRPGPGGPYPRIANAPPGHFRPVVQMDMHGNPQQVAIQRQLPPGAVPQMHPGQGPMHPQSMPMNQMSGPGGAQLMQMPVTTGAIIDRIKLDDLIKQVDPSTVLEDNVKDALVEYTDEFVGEIIDKVCTLVQHRGNKRLEVRDVELVLDMVNNMPSVPRAAVHVFGQPPTIAPKTDAFPPTEAHKQRLMLIKKQLKKI